MRFFCLLLLAAMGSLVNERVVRVIDLTQQVEKQIVKTEVRNTGRKSTRTYHFPIPLEKKPQLAFFKAVDEQSTELSSKLIDTIELSEEFQTKKEKHFFLEVQLTTPMETDDVIQLTITLVYIHVLQMLPAKIQQKDNQYVVYEGNRFCDSIYPTKKQHTKINVASENIKSYTKDGQESLTGKKLKYGTYEGVKPFGFKNVRVHFRNNNAFLTMDNVVRDMEVSHWGNVRVSEFYNIRHDGARLTGPYESEDAMMAMYGRNRLAEPSAVRELKATLPAGASRVTYTDRIGNISTSHFRRGRKKSTLELEMRYKLVGGWKTDFSITYDVTASEFISVSKSDSSLHYFDGSFGIPFSKPVANYVKTSVALPEGAYDVKVNLPFDVDTLDYSVRYTYLDSQLFGGRPVVYFIKTNVVHEHFTNFSISYRYSPVRIYFKVFMLVVGFFVFFMAFSFLGRLDMSLKDNSNNPALLEPALDAIIQLETEDEKVIWNHLEGLQTQMNRIEGLPSSILKRMEMLMKLRHSSKKNKHHVSKLLNKAKNFCEEAKGMFKLKSQ